MNRDGKSLQNSTHKTLQSEKLAHKICASNAKNRAKFAKTPKIAQKRPKIFNKTRENPKISTVVKN